MRPQTPGPNSLGLPAGLRDPAPSQLCIYAKRSIGLWGAVGREELAGSLLSHGWPGGPSSPGRGRETLGVTPLVWQIYMCFLIFMEGYRIPTSSLCSGDAPPPPRLFLCLRSLQGLPHPGQSPTCLVQELPCPANGPAEGATAAHWVRLCPLPLPSLVMARYGGPCRHPHPLSAPAMLCLDSQIFF